MKNPRQGAGVGARLLWSAAGLLTALTAWMVDMGVAEAVPAFARKYDMTCNVCHTRQPRLNTFGQRFLENGYQLPGTEDGGVTLKRLLGGELNGATVDDVANFFAVRLRADVQKATFREDTTPRDELDVRGDPDIVFPRTINLFFAGTATKNVSFFLEGEFDTQDPAESFFAFERAYLAFDNIGGHQIANFKIGKYDPSSFFSFPTHRQQLNPIKPKAETNEFPPPIGRIPLLPLAFASKMFGLTTGPSNADASNGIIGAGPLTGLERFTGTGNDGYSILPFEPWLFNAPFQKGMSLHGRPFGPRFLYQVGLVQNSTAEDTPDTRWDTYVMLRYDQMAGDYSAFQVSAFYYRAPKAARATLAPPPISGDVIFSDDALDWKRYGVGARWQYRFIDVYGTVIWDKIDQPDFGNAAANTSDWETDALGVSLEADWLITQKWMLGARYDFMRTGGLSRLPVAFRAPGDEDLNQDASFLSVIAKYYYTPNIGLYGRVHYNLEDSVNQPANVGGGEEHPATNLESMVTIGVDMAF